MPCRVQHSEHPLSAWADAQIVHATASQPSLLTCPAMCLSVPASEHAVFCSQSAKWPCWAYSVTRKDMTLQALAPQAGFATTGSKPIDSQPSGISPRENWNKERCGLGLTGCTHPSWKTHMLESTLLRGGADTADWSSSCDAGRARAIRPPRHRAG